MKGQHRDQLPAESLDAIVTGPHDGLTFTFQGTSEPSTPPAADETILLEATPRPQPEPDIPLADLAAWVDARIDEVATEIEADLARYDDWIARLLHDLDKHTAGEKQHADNYTAGWQQHIDAKCASGMTDPETKPTPKAASPA